MCYARMVLIITFFGSEVKYVPAVINKYETEKRIPNDVFMYLSN